jgi:hypothetical protein
VERSQIFRALIGTVAVAWIGSGCANPFAPALRGTTGSLWTNASTVGKLLQNFTTAYEVRDSLEYSDLLADDFQFQYYDAQLQRTDGWYRETDLRTTARMFRSFDNIALIWGSLAPGVDTVSAEDTEVDVQVQYQLILDELSPVIGFAHFKLYKPTGDRFRILLWQDGI